VSAPLADVAAAHVRTSRRAQGLPPNVDAAVVNAIAEVIRNANGAGTKTVSDRSAPSTGGTG
jgi:hypothetical protein